MKKWLCTATMLTVLAACSASNESKQQANDSFEKKSAELPAFAPLATGGITLPKQDQTYQLPQIKAAQSQNIDIRPPTSPLAIIPNSIAQFDGERSLIAYPLSLQDVYNLKQVERLLKEQNISYNLQGEKILTDWAPTGRADDVGNPQIRYQIEQITTRDARALLVSIAQMKRDEIIFTPTQADKQRYTSDRLNTLVGDLNAAYRKQQNDLNNVGYTPIQTALATDTNGRTALAMNAGFSQSWERLAGALPQLGFETKSQQAGRGYRELKYSPLEDNDWLRFGVNKPDLEKGVYSMQLSALGKQSAVVISDEKGNALSGAQAQAVYQALQALLAK
ncbi:outer membrane protein assembly factor BamC [Caviibacterium pharyngocola]|uniref:Outer membrane protein assembly factor BamC n=1 Tax=Caviibacterium pharyngocola TaxID=28159 RepID=A0A2M8RXA9_9PAST|nr:outer membrane protein assembly factor BamC [Caviibacterium pharyngocola]PJG83522.1 outer membrane assembly protein BamC [Caviibacterium pharyngocola]